MMSLIQFIERCLSLSLSELLVCFLVTKSQIVLVLVAHIQLWSQVIVQLLKRWIVNWFFHECAPVLNWFPARSMQWHSQSSKQWAASLKFHIEMSSLRLKNWGAVFTPFNSVHIPPRTPRHHATNSTITSSVSSLNSVTLEFSAFYFSHKRSAACTCLGFISLHLNLLCFRIILL